MIIKGTSIVNNMSTFNDFKKVLMENKDIYTQEEIDTFVPNGDIVEIINNLESYPIRVFYFLVDKLNLDMEFILEPKK